MPTYEYQARDESQACVRCRLPFEVVQRMTDPPLSACPLCGTQLRKLISTPCVNTSAGKLDDRARAAGFQTLKRLGKGAYERQD